MKEKKVEDQKTEQMSDLEQIKRITGGDLSQWNRAGLLLCGIKMIATVLTLKDFDSFSEKNKAKTATLYCTFLDLLIEAVKEEITGEESHPGGIEEWIKTLK